MAVLYWPTHLILVWCIRTIPRHLFMIFLMRSLQQYFWWHNRYLKPKHLSWTLTKWVLCLYLTRSWAQHCHNIKFNLKIVMLSFNIFVFCRNVQYQHTFWWVRPHSAMWDVKPLEVSKNNLLTCPPLLFKEQAIYSKHKHRQKEATVACVDNVAPAATNWNHRRSCILPSNIISNHTSFKKPNIRNRVTFDVCLIIQDVMSEMNAQKQINNTLFFKTTEWLHLQIWAENPTERNSLISRQRRETMIYITMSLIFF